MGPATAVRMTVGLVTIARSQGNSDCREATASPVKEARGFTSFGSDSGVGEVSEATVDPATAVATGGGATAGL